MTEPIRLQNQWTRSNEGWVAGVCQGLGENFGINPGLLRLMWAFSILFFGVGLFFYFICAFCLPLEGREEEAMKPKFLGVCARLAYKMNVDVGLLRIVAVLVGLGSLGTTVLAYIVIHFILPPIESYQ